MTRDSHTRRRFSIAIATGSALALAGCQELTGGDDGGGNGDGTPTDDGDDGGDGIEPSESSVLTIVLEDENGHPVTSGVAVTVEYDGRRDNLGDASNDGGVMTVTTSKSGEFTITAESTYDEFDPVEETVTVEDGRTPRSRSRSRVSGRLRRRDGHRS